MSVCKSVLLSLAMFVLSLGAGYGQAKPTAADSIDAKFERLLQNSNSWKEYNRKYKVVRLNGIEKIRRAAHQKIEELDTKNRKLHSKLEDQQAEMASFKEANQQEKEPLQNRSETKRQNEVTVLGFINLTKETLQVLIWSLIGLLLLLVLVFNLTKKKSKRLAIEARDRLKIQEKKFDDYQKKALDTQQKLGRQLQDIRNKMTKDDAFKNEDS